MAEEKSCCISEGLKENLTCVDVSIFSQGPAVVFRWLNAGYSVVDFVTSNVAHLFGYSSEQFKNDTVHFDTIIHPDDFERVIRELNQHTESGASQFQHEDYRVIAKDGSLRWVEHHTQIVRDTKGQATHYLGYVLNMTERKLAEDKLIKAKLLAEKASKAKSEFLSRMSHELRTPMTAILGYTELVLEDENSLNDEHTKYLKRVLKSGNHLLELINQVLDLSIIESDEVELSFSNVELRELFDSCMSMLKADADKYDIHLVDKTVGTDLGTIWTDKLKLKQVLINLMSNAVKYNRPDGSVTLSVDTLESGHLRIEVKDTGEGLTQKQVGELFQPFHRLVNDPGGLMGIGIGLVITKELIELLGGTIGVKSTPGEGSIFWIELLPLEKVST